MWARGARQAAGKLLAGELRVDSFHGLGEQLASNWCNRATLSALASSATVNGHTSWGHGGRHDRAPVTLPSRDGVLGGVGIGLLALNAQQTRSFTGWFRKAPSAVLDAPPDTPAEPPLDLELVQSIVDMTSGPAADAMAWSTIHQGVTYPTYAAQLILGGIHDYGALGAPLQWPLAILGAVVVMRTCTAPLMVMQMRSSFNMGKTKPMIEELQKGLMARLQRGDPVRESQEWYMREVQKVWKEHNSNPLLAMVPIVVNLPMFLGMYWGMLTMCEGGLPSLATEDGLPWVHDLSKADPTHALQLAVPFTLWAQIQLSALEGLEGMSGQMRTYFVWMARLLPVIMIPVMWNFQAALCLYWTYSNIYSIGFSGLLRIPAVRKSFGLPSRREMIDVQIRNAQSAGSGLAANNASNMFKLPSFSASSAPAPQAQVSVAPAASAASPAKPRARPAGPVNVPTSQATLLRARREAQSGKRRPAK